jgi:hypothetical protein
MVTCFPSRRWSLQSKSAVHCEQRKLVVDYRVIQISGWPGHNWALPNIVELQRIMAHAFKHPADALEKGRQARMDVIRNFSLRVIGRKLVEEFRRIEKLVSSRKSAPKEL